ncbi:hypothetical protein C8Q75DRAFT_587382 [Abortiporus biennis]|nr:hypothetical protein C8Q75DRAFT_587382 [Abortiporus biennis]
MAGHGYVKQDPAIERWNNMREDAYKHFRFTRKTSLQVFAGLVAFPLAIYFISAKTDGRWKWDGKRKGESLNA